MGDDAVGASYGGHILATTDGGAAWTTQYLYSSTTAGLTKVACANATDAWVVGDRGIALATTDGGAAWAARDSGTDADLNDVAFANASDGWVVDGSGTILGTTDGGATWSTQCSGLTEPLTGVASPTPVMAGRWAGTAPSSRPPPAASPTPHRPRRPSPAPMPSGTTPP